MNLDTMYYNPGADAFYSLAFRAVLEDHMTFLRSLASTQVIGVDKQNLWKYEGDLFGLFREMKIPEPYHFAIMRLNGLESATYVPEDFEMMLLCDYQEIENIKQAYTATNRIT